MFPQPRERLCWCRQSSSSDTALLRSAAHTCLFLPLTQDSRDTFLPKPTQPCKSASETAPGDQSCFCCGWLLPAPARSDLRALCLGCSLRHVELLSCKRQGLLFTTPSGQRVHPGHWAPACCSGCLCFSLALGWHVSLAATPPHPHQGQPSLSQLIRRDS